MLILKKQPSKGNQQTASNLHFLSIPWPWDILGRTVSRRENTCAVCVCVSVSVLLLAGQSDNHWPPVGSLQETDPSLGPAGPARYNQHHRLSVESQASGWYHTQTDSHTRSDTLWSSTPQGLCWSKGLIFTSAFPSPQSRFNLELFSLHCSDITSKSKYRSAPFPGLYPLQLLCVFLIRSSSLPWRQQHCSPRVAFKHAVTPGRDPAQAWISAASQETPQKCVLCSEATYQASNLIYDLIISDI